MPELPEVEITARLIGSATGGRRIESALAPGVNTLRTYDPPLSATAGKKTEYDIALALQNFLRDPANFAYDTTYDPKATGSDALSYFLFVSKKGYCQQFAGAFAVMARELGLPTRLALGWTYGQQAGDVYSVTADEYHTWPEVYFQGVGWVPFEPTPGRGIPGAEGYTTVPTAQLGTLQNPSSTTAPTTAPGLSAADAAAAAAAAARRVAADQGGGSGSTVSAMPGSITRHSPPTL